MKDTLSRRTFVSRILSGAGAALTLSAIPGLAEAHKHAAQQMQSGSKTFHFFTASEAKELEAVCEQIIPSDEVSPGAREAG